MTYKVNGTEIVIQPTAGRWLPREELGRDGNGQPIYPATREFELDWNLIDQEAFDQLQGFFDAVHITGSAIVDLPQYATNPYAFVSYTGCVLSEPQVGRYFTEHTMNVTLLITRIRT